jgi:predicted dehydrogenase
MTFNLKQNDTSPNIQAQMFDGDGSPVDITNATVRFHVRNAEGTVIIDEPAVILSATDGTVEYGWVAADTATAGTFQAEFEVTYESGKIETFPNSSYIEIVITDDIT